MTELQRLEARILELHGTLSLRPTLERAGEIGELLLAAKKGLAHGRWAEWCRRLPFSLRTSRVYCQIAKRQAAAEIPERLSIDGFLRQIGLAKRAARRESVEEARTTLAAGVSQGAYRVVLGDCTKYKWPLGIDAICTDPPWGDRSCYTWLAEFASGHLRPGGILLAQCGNADLPEVLQVMSSTLRYVWTLAIIYENGRQGGRVLPPFVSSWRPVVVFAKGEVDRSKDICSDTWTVLGKDQENKLHPWQQPLSPWKFWLSRLSMPGWTIADPFAGTGTIGTACKLIGKRKYLGTEVDRDTWKIAVARLAEAVEGSGV